MKCPVRACLRFSPAASRVLPKRTSALLSHVRALRRVGRMGARPTIFQNASGEFRQRAFKRGLCWVCGEPLGVHKVYAIGPMCVINRTTSEPASHRDCAEFAVKACPFLLEGRACVASRLARVTEPKSTRFGTLIERVPAVTAARRGGTWSCISLAVAKTGALGSSSLGRMATVGHHVDR